MKKKRVVVLTGSPRQNGNSFAMTDAFVKAAEAKGHKVVRFDAAFMNVGGCHDCETCYSKGVPCSYEDDFNLIAPEIEKADVVVFTMPVYWYTMPAQIKAVIDKLYSFVIGGIDTAGKRCGLITCCEELDSGVMDGVRMPYLRSAELLGWKSIGEVCVPGVFKIGDIERSDGCAKAAALAEQI